VDKVKLDVRLRQGIAQLLKQFAAVVQQPMLQCHDAGDCHAIACVVGPSSGGKCSIL
jgi:hypothetical protein